MAMASPMFAMRIKRIILDRSDSSTVEAPAVAGSAERSETAMSGVSSTAGAAAAAGSADGAASPSFPSHEGC